jgi:hypothetical protein
MQIDQSPICNFQSAKSPPAALEIQLPALPSKIGKWFRCHLVIILIDYVPRRGGLDDIYDIPLFLDDSD